MAAVDPEVAVGGHLAEGVRGLAGDEHRRHLPGDDARQELLGQEHTTGGGLTGTTEPLFHRGAVDQLDTGRLYADTSIGRDANGEWSIENIDRNSAGFEHASYITDLDGDGRDELYVASDKDGEVRRYVWNAEGDADRSVIHRHVVRDSILTWNLAVMPSGFFP